MTLFINLDTKKTAYQGAIRCKRGDTDIRLEVELSEGIHAYEIPEGSYAVFCAQKNDGNMLFNACEIRDGKIIYDFTEQTAAAVGIEKCEIKLYNTENRLITSPHFMLIVEGTVFKDDSQAESAPEFSALTKLISDTLAIFGTTTEHVKEAVAEWLAANPEACIDEDVINAATRAWMDEHPEASTTVQDGAISEPKLSDSVREKVDAVPVLKQDLTQLTSDSKYNPIEHTFIVGGIDGVGALNTRNNRSRFMCVSTPKMLKITSSDSNVEFQYHEYNSEEAGSASRIVSTLWLSEYEREMDETSKMFGVCARYTDDRTLSESNISHIGECISIEYFTEKGAVKDLQDRVTVLENSSHEINLEIHVPECSECPIAVCSNGSNSYQSPIGQNSAECSLNYAQFTTSFFDKYIKRYLDGYSVTKRSLGRDSSKHYDVVEYTFTPKRYSRTVMLSAGMNACELPAEFGVATFIANVVDKIDDSYKWLRDNVRFKVIPVLCPWSFDQSPMKYENYNGVNLNKNFDYNHSWDNYSGGGQGSKGDYPMSEAETVLLMNWINENANNCDFWIDCHTDSSGIAESATAYLHTCIASDNATKEIIKNAQASITSKYIELGYFATGAEKTEPTCWTESGNNYPKQLYSKNVCGIPSLMIEQYVGNPYYGGNKTVSNTSADINNYVTMLRAYVLAMLKRSEIVIKGDDLKWYMYQYFMQNHSLDNDAELLVQFELGGVNSYSTKRAVSEYIGITTGQTIVVTNMTGFELVDVAKYDANKNFISTTSGYSKTNVGSDWNIHITTSNFAYIRFSIRKTDNSDIDLAALAESIITVS